MKDEPTIGEVERAKIKLYNRFYKQYIKDKKKPYDLNVDYWHGCSKFVEEGVRKFLYYGKRP